MALEAVIDLLGGSVAAEELKGDYAAAEAAAAASLEAARASGDPQRRADAAIAAGVVAALRFAAADATARLEEALAAVPNHPLGTALRHVAIGAARRLPDGRGRQAEAIDFWTEPLSGDPLEVELYVLTLLPSQRTTVQIAAALDPENLPLALDASVQALALISDRRPYARLAAAGLYRDAGRQADADAELEAARAAYAAAGDAAGAAGCDLARAEWTALPAGSPITFGLELSESPSTSTSELHGAFDRTSAPLGDVAAAESFYARAEDGFRAAGCPRGVAMVDLQRAGLAALGGDAAAALVAAERARAGFEAAGDAAGAQLALAHGVLAGVQAGRWPERADLATGIGEWGRTSGAAGWALGIGMLFSQVGWRRLRRGGDPDRALACHRLARATFTALGAPEFAQQTLADAALAHDAGGDWRAALVAGDAALDAFAELQPDEAGALALREGDLANLVRALAYTARDADVLERVRPGLERLQEHLAALGRGEGIAAGLPPEALEQPARAAVAIAGDLELDSALAPAWRSLAAHRRNPLQANALRDTALSAAAAVPDERRGRLEALLLLTLGDVPAAQAAFRLRPPPDPDPPDPLTLIELAALVVALEDWPEARRRHEQIAQLLGRPDWSDGTSRPWRQIADLARTAEGLGEHARAQELYAAALEGVEAQRAVLLRRADAGALGDAQAEAGLYADAARETLAGGDAASALGIAERGRARGLLGRLAASAALAPAPAGQSADLRAWRELAARIDVLTWLAARDGDAAAAELAAAQEELEALEARLAATDPRWLQAVAPPAAPLGAAEIAQALPAGTVLIEYLLASDALLAWAVAPDGVVTGRATPLASEAADELQRKLWIAAQGRSALWERFAQQFGALLLDPFDDAIAASDHVVVVAHRWGHVAPVAALHWRGAALVDVKTVSVLPSASALRFLRPGGAPAAGAPLFVGDPANMSRRRPGEAAASGGFGALPWSGAQAAEAAGWLGAGAPLLGPDAREQAVRDALPSARLAHFGTHGVLDEAPLLSCIVLAEGDTLDVWELLGLQLDADLVTLSACDSAATPVTPGDEITGLAWLTLAAGARAVLAGLWKVNELSTALLMRTFYAALRDGEPPSKALAAAQHHLRGLTRASAAPEIAALRAAAVAAGRPDPGEPGDLPEDFAHPYHWAGFVLIGV